FLNERRNQHSHAHKRDSHIAILEEVLDRGILRRFDGDGDDHNDQRQRASKKKVKPWLSWRFSILAVEFSPAEGLPEWRPIEKCQRDVKKTEKKRIPQHHRADGENRLRQGELLKLFLRRMRRDRFGANVVRNEHHLHGGQSEEAVNRKKNQ